MVLIINDNIRIWKKYSNYDLIAADLYNIDSEELFLAKMTGESPAKIYICGREFDVIPFYMAVRTPNEDGYFRFIYIQINYSTGEYYIGKVNRQRRSEFMRYYGSGVKFKAKYGKHNQDFYMYYIAHCSSQEETEKLEAEIVNDELLKDPFCLNLVRGGAGTNNASISVDRRKKQREYMKTHPDQYQAMVKAAKELYLSGDSTALRQRGAKIKETMSDDKYRSMMSQRITKWIRENPEAYKQARENNRLAMQTEESKQKRNRSLGKWREDNPEKFQEYRRRQLAAAHSLEAEAKRSASLRQWNKDHPDAVKKRSLASNAACQKAVNMLDLETREVIRTFPSQMDAALWLVENGYAKNTNCKSSISAVCLHKKCTTGHGYRTQAHGFGWEFTKS